MKRQFFKYTIPATFSFLLTGIYTIMDGFFVGKKIGDLGLAAINIAWPLVMVMMALGTGLGMGGSVISSLKRGAKDEKTASKAEGTTISVLIFCSFCLMIILFFFSEAILKRLGAKGETLIHANAYINTITLGCIFQVMSCGFIPILRNRGKSIFAMLAMVSGCLCNIIFDWLFVVKWNMGMSGAALATIMGQLVTVVPCTIFFLLKENRIPLKNMIPDLALLKNILKVAVSPMGITLLPSITVILTNLQILKYADDTAVAAFSVMVYVIESIQLIIQGISDGSQPLISLYQGAKDHKKVRMVQKLMYTTTSSVALFGMVLLFILRTFIPVLFGTSTTAGIIIVDVLPIFLIAFIFYAFTRSTTAYFYAIEKTKAASIMVYGEVLVTSTFIIILPYFFKLSGVWVTMLMTQIVLSIIGYLLLKKSYLKRMKQIK